MVPEGPLQAQGLNAAFRYTLVLRSVNLENVSLIVLINLSITISVSRQHLKPVFPMNESLLLYVYVLVTTHLFLSRYMFCVTPHHFVQSMQRR